MPITVSEIAERLSDDVSQRAALVERLRHWTREGLLVPMGDRNPGTGRHRVYEDSTAFDAAILNALADQGFQVGRQSYFSVAMGLIDEAKRFWAEKGRSGKTLYLEIANFAKSSIARRENQAVFLHKGRRDLIHSSADSSFALNVSRIFRRLDKQN